MNLYWLRCLVTLVALATIVNGEELRQGRYNILYTSREILCTHDVSKWLGVDFAKLMDIGETLRVKMYDMARSRWKGTNMKETVEAAFPNDEAAQSTAYDILVEIQLCILQPEIHGRYADDCIMKALTVAGLSREQFRKLYRISMIHGVYAPFDDENKTKLASTLFSKETIGTLGVYHDEWMFCSQMVGMTVCELDGIDRTGVSIREMYRYVWNLPTRVPLENRVKAVFPGDEAKQSQWKSYENFVNECFAEQRLEDERNNRGCYYTSLEKTGLVEYGKSIIKNEIVYDLETNDGQEKLANMAKAVAKSTFPTDVFLQMKVREFFNLYNDCVKNSNEPTL